MSFITERPPLYFLAYGSSGKFYQLDARTHCQLPISYFQTVYKSVVAVYKDAAYTLGQDNDSDDVKWLLIEKD